MHCKRISLIASVLSLTGATALAQTAPAITDTQIVHFVYVAAQVDAEAAALAQQKALDQTVRSFADAGVREQAATKQLLLPPAGSGSKATVDSLGETLAGNAAEQREALAKLSGAAFDKAYMENEVLFHLLVVGALETTLICRFPLRFDPAFPLRTDPG